MKPTIGRIKLIVEVEGFDPRIGRAWGINPTQPLVLEWFSPEAYLDGTFTDEDDIDVYQISSAAAPTGTSSYSTYFNVVLWQ
jgi:hypothetical protein